MGLGSLGPMPSMTRDDYMTTTPKDHIINAISRISCNYGLSWLQYSLRSNETHGISQIVMRHNLKTIYIPKLKG